MVDGTGGPRRQADVGVTGERVSAIDGLGGAQARRWPAGVHGNEDVAEGVWAFAERRPVLPELRSEPGDWQRKAR